MKREFLNQYSILSTFIGAKVTTDFYENEVFEIVDAKENQFNLKGDWSGGTHNVCQTSWYPAEKCKFILPETEWIAVR